MTKSCSKCKEVKAFTDFYKNKASKDGLAPLCASCANQRFKSYSQNENYKAKKRTAFKEIYAKNSKYYNDHRKLYDKLHPEKRNFWCRQYQINKLKATPKWLTEEDRKKIEALYMEAKRLSKESGIIHEVDHIIPLKGKNVCGLHVPSNLQILTKHENCKKSNKYGDLQWHR